MKLPVIGAITAAAIFLCACADEVTAPTTPQSELAARVAALGFRTAGMQDHGTYVVVEGDIRLEKSDLLARPRSTALDDPHGHGILTPPSRPRTQFSANTLVAQYYVKQITVDLSGVASEVDWAQSARNAMADYNASGSGVQMSEASPGDITLSVDATLGTDIVSQASFPYQSSTSGKPGPTIHVNPYFDGYSTSQKERVLTHELGHTLGLRHSDWYDTSNGRTSETTNIGANQVSGTPYSDASSIMNWCTCNYSWAGFSNYDLVAIRTLYPIPTYFLTIHGPYFISSPGEYTYTLYPNTAPSSAYYKWEEAFCYSYPCGSSYGSYMVLAEGVGVTSVQMEFFEEDLERDVIVTVWQNSDGTGEMGTANKTISGPRIN